MFLNINQSFSNSGPEEHAFPLSNDTVTRRINGIPYDLQEQIKSKTNVLP